MPKKRAVAVLYVTPEKSEAWKTAIRLGPSARGKGTQYSVGVTSRKGVYNVELFEESR